MRTISVLGVFVAAVSMANLGCGGSSSTPSGPSGTGAIALSGSLDFGTVVGGTSKELSFSISNSGSQGLTVSGINVPAGFTASWTSGTVAAGQTQSVAVRFTPTLDQSYSGTLTVASTAASGSNTLTISARGSRTGRVIDPVGDALSDGRVAGPPDLTEADVRATGSVLSVSVTFAPGTTTPQSDIWATVALDTDENPATGFQGVDPSGQPGGRDNGVIGVDYLIQFVTPRGSTGAEIYRVGPSGLLDRVGTTGVSFQGASQFVISVPLSLLGGDDGRLGFKVNGGKWGVDQQRIRGMDYLPNEGLPVGLTP